MEIGLEFGLETALEGSITANLQYQGENAPILRS